MWNANSEILHSVKSHIKWIPKYLIHHIQCTWQTFSLPELIPQLAAAAVVEMTDIYVWLQLLEIYHMECYGFSNVSSNTAVPIFKVNLTSGVGVGGDLTVGSELEVELWLDETRQCWAGNSYYTTLIPCMWCQIPNIH